MQTHIYKFGIVIYASIQFPILFKQLITMVKMFEVTGWYYHVFKEGLGFYVSSLCNPYPHAPHVSTCFQYMFPSSDSYRINTTGILLELWIRPITIDLLIYQISSSKQMIICNWFAMPFLVPMMNLGFFALRVTFKYMVYVIASSLNLIKWRGIVHGILGINFMFVYRYTTQ